MPLLRFERWVLGNEDKCCVVTTRGTHSRRLACLRPHVLRAYCNFKSKQANSITLFVRRPSNQYNLYDSEDNKK